jgi:hypothetical protein
LYRHRLYLVYKLLNNLRKTEPVFGTTDYTYSLSSYSKRLQLNDPDMKVNILGNFGVTPTTVFPAFQQAGKWYECFTGDSLIITDVNGQITFDAGEYRLYTTKRLPSSKLILGTEDLFLPEKDGLISVYPNPSENEFNFVIKNDFPESVTITIFDLTGRIIKQMKTRISGSEIITWDGKTGNGSEAPAGLYIVQIHSMRNTGTVKIIKK